MLVNLLENLVQNMTRSEGQRILDKYLPRRLWQLHPVTVWIVGPILLRVIADLVTTSRHLPRYVLRCSQSRQNCAVSSSSRWSSAG